MKTCAINAKPGIKHINISCTILSKKKQPGSQQLRPKHFKKSINYDYSHYYICRKRVCTKESKASSM